MRPIVAILMLVLEATGCIAYRAATPAWLDGPASVDPARRRKAIRARGVIATSVGAGELAVAVAVTLALIVHGGSTSDGVSSENPAGAAGQGVKDLGAQLAGYLLLGGLGATAMISGIGDVACGVKDLRGASTCDEEVRAWYPEEDHTGGTTVASLPASIAGEFEGDGAEVVQLSRDGSFRSASHRSSFDATRFEALGTWRLDGTRLTLTRTKGACAASGTTRTGVYVVSASSSALRFRKVHDVCVVREAFDWWRIHDGTR